MTNNSIILKSSEVGKGKVILYVLALVLMWVAAFLFGAPAYVGWGLLYITLLAAFLVIVSFYRTVVFSKDGVTIKVLNIRRFCSWKSLKFRKKEEIVFGGFLKPGFSIEGYVFSKFSTGDRGNLTIPQYAFLRVFTLVYVGFQTGSSAYTDNILLTIAT